VELLTNIHASSPNWDVHVGYVVKVDGATGMLGVRMRIGNNDIDTFNFLNSTFLEERTTTLKDDGASGVLFTIEKTGGGDLSIYFDGVFTNFPTTSEATCTAASNNCALLTLGTDAIPTLNYIYILKSTNALTVSTSGWPAADHATVSTVYAQSFNSIITNGDGPYKEHPWINHLSSTGTGHIGHINQWIRSQHATYLSGVAPTFTGSGTGSITAEFTSGQVLQLHEHAFGAQTSPATMWITNESGVGYKEIDNINDITTDSDGDTLTSKTYGLVFWGSVNKNTGESKIFVNLPSGSYAKNQATLVREDLDKFQDFNIPQEFRGTGFLIHRMVVDEFGGTYTIYSGEGDDLRGQLPGTSTGGSVGVGTEFPDSLFRIFNTADATKEIAFDASGVTTGNTRTYVAPDYDGTLALATGIGGGQTIYGSDLASEHLILDSTSNATKGEVQIPTGTKLQLGTVTTPQTTPFQSSRGDNGYTGIFEGPTGFGYLYQFGTETRLGSGTGRLLIRGQQDVSFSSSGFNWGGIDGANGWGFGYGVVEGTAGKVVTIRGKTSDSTADALYVTDSSNAEKFAIRNDGLMTASGLNYPLADGSSGQVMTTDGTGDITFENIPPSVPSIYQVFDAEDGDSSLWSDSGTAVMGINSSSPMRGLHNYICFTGASGDKCESPPYTLQPRHLEAHSTHSIKGIYENASGEFTARAIDNTGATIPGSERVLDASATAEPFELLFNIPSGITTVRFEVENTTYVGSDILHFDDLTFDDDSISTANLTTINSVELDGNDGRAITADTENIFWSGSGTGWTSGGGVTDNYYTVQNDGSIIHIKGSINTTASTDASMMLYKNGSVHKWMRRTNASYTRHHFNYVTTKGEFVAGDKLSIRIDHTVTLNSTTSISYFRLNEVSVADHVIRSGESRLTEWESFTPTGTWTSNTTYTGSWRRVGSNLEVHMKVALAGAPTAAQLNVILPDGLNVDTSVIPNEQRDTHFGGVTFKDAGTGYRYQGYVSTGVTADRLEIALLEDSGVGAYESVQIISNTIPVTVASGDEIHINYSVPIQGWTAGMPETYLLPQSEQQDFWAGFTVGGVLEEPYNTSGITAVWTSSTHWVIDYSSLNLSSKPKVNAVPADSSYYVYGVSSVTATGCELWPRNIDTLALAAGPFRFSLKKSGADASSGQVFLGQFVPGQTMYIKDIKTSGTNGGSSTANTVHTRDLSTLSGDIFGSLSGDAFTLPAGEYKIEVEAPALNASRHQVFLHDGASYILDGVSAYDGTGGSTTYATLKGSFLITTSTTFEIRHWTSNAQATSGLGLAADNDVSNPQSGEVYTTVKIETIGKKQ